MNTKEFHNRMDSKRVQETIEHLLYRNEGPIEMIKTGIQSFDSCFGGFRKRETYVLSGSYGMGKTLFALTVACNLAFDQNKKVLCFSPSSTLRSNILRVLQIRAGAGSWIDRTEEDIEKMKDIAKDLKSVPLIINDTPNLTPAELYEACKQEDNLNLIIINRYQNISGASREEVANILQRIALLCNCPVLILFEITGDYKEDGKGGLKDVWNNRFGYKQILIPAYDNFFILYRPYYYDLKREQNAYIYAVKDSSGIMRRCTMDYAAETQYLS